MVSAAAGLCDNAYDDVTYAYDDATYVYDDMTYVAEGEEHAWCQRLQACATQRGAG